MWNRFATQIGNISVNLGAIASSQFCTSWCFHSDPYMSARPIVRYPSHQRINYIVIPCDIYYRGHHNQTRSTSMTYVDVLATYCIAAFFPFAYCDGLCSPSHVSCLNFPLYIRPCELYTMACVLVTLCSWGACRLLPRRSPSSLPLFLLDSKVSTTLLPILLYVIVPQGRLDFCVNGE